MKFSIEVDLDDAELQRTALSIARGLFEKPEGWRTTNLPPGYAAILAAVTAAIAELDLGPLVRAVVAKMVPGIVDGVVEAELRKRVRAVVKRETDEGTLIPKGD